MPSNAIRYEVLIASPGDVMTERDVIEGVVRDWNSAHSRASRVTLQCRRWELDAVPEAGDRAQGILNQQLVDEADILIGVFSARLGTPTGVAPSGTVEEIERVRGKHKPVLLYFSKAPVPRNHDPEQLRMLNEYKKELAATALFFEYENGHDLQRLVSRHLASQMAATVAAAVEPPKSKSQLARLNIRIGQKGRSGDVSTVKVIAEITNLSHSIRLREYGVTLSVPAASLTFESAKYMAEIPSDVPGRRKFRATENQFANVRIHPGDTMQVFSLDLGIDQLKLVGTYLAGDYEGALADKVVADAFADGETMHTERTLSEIFGR